MFRIQIAIDNLLRDAGIAVNWVPYLKVLIMVTLVMLLAYGSLVITQRVFVKIFHSFMLRTSAKWDDILVESRCFHKLAYLVPVLIVRTLAPVAFGNLDFILPFIIKCTDAALVLVVVTSIMSFFRGLEILLSTSPIFRDKPLASYFQLGRIIIYSASAILILSIMLGRSPVYFLSAFGAMTAILLLIFKDTILGLVASVQISANDMVRVGDWVEMPKFHADGDVVAINLNTVKIRNWDKTITTIPTYYFITDSFKNWRGMQESGGRRIKRAIYINLRSIKFVDKAMRERFKRFYIVKDYIEQRVREIEQYNAENDIDTGELINGRRMTNIGVFRRYAEAYLRNQKRIRQDMTLLVRQLPPEDHGLPIEIYCFTATTAWAEYEEIQADVFDHLLAAAKHFDLEVFQAPSGNDIVLAGEKLGRSAQSFWDDSKAIDGVMKLD